MKYKLKILIIALNLALICIFTSCKSGRSSLSPKTQDNKVQDNKVQEKSSEDYVSTMQFGVMDPNYNFTLNKKIPVTELKRDYPVFKNSSVSYLKKGDQYLRYRMDLIDAAKSSIYLQTFIYDDAEVAWKISEKLVEAKKRGVDVKLIIDEGTVTYVKKQDLYKYLKLNGIKFEGYEVAYMNMLNLIPKNMDLKSLMDNLNYRKHEKIFVVDPGLDSGVAIIGGTNIANEYFGVEPTNYLKNWTDKDVSLKGDIVVKIAEDFLETWTYLQDQHSQGSYEFFGKLWTLPQNVINALSITPLKYNAPTLDSKIIKRINKALNTDLDLSYSESDIRYLYNKPKQNHLVIYDAYVDAINSSKVSINMINAYFIPSIEMRQAILDAVKRGVKIKIITNSDKATDISAIVRVGRLLYDEILSYNQYATGNGGIEIYEWEGHTVLNNNKGLLHSKYAVFDDKLVIVGSYNLDPRSQNLSTENVILTENPKLVSSLSKEFDKYLSQDYSQMVTEEEARSFLEAQDLQEKLINNFSDALIPLL